MTKQEKINRFDPSGVGIKNGHFIGLPFDEADAEIVLLPVPWDVTVSYADGTSTGAQNILEASAQLDLFDPDLPDAWKIGIYMRHLDIVWLNRNIEMRPQAEAYIDFLENGGNLLLDRPMQITLQNLNVACEQLRKWVFEQTTDLMKRGKRVGVVGGEHSVPLGYLEALANRYGEFGVLQIDAHQDLRQSYEGFTFSHASIFFNALKIRQISRLVQVGIRDNCMEEVQIVQASRGRVQLHYDQDLRRAQFEGESWAKICEKIIEPLPHQVYVSFDIDGLKPNLCPNTGTPVPGGLEFDEAIFLLKKVVDSGREIIGFDLCEVAGLEHEWDGNVGARVLYKLCNLMGKSINK